MLFDGKRVKFLIKVIGFMKCLFEVRSSVQNLGRIAEIRAFRKCLIHKIVSFYDFRII